MSLADQYNLSTIVAFQQRVQASLVNYCISTINAEVTNDVQTITVTGTPTGGSFTLANGPLTGAVAPAWNATAQVLQAQLQAALAAGNACVCTGGPLPGTPIIVTWTSGLGNSPQLVLTVSANNLTGGVTPNASVAHTTVGVAAANHAARASLSSKVLVAPTTYGVQFASAVATDTTVQSDYVANHLQTDVTDAHINAAVAAQVNSFT
jgi:hypothetical protein